MQERRVTIVNKLGLHARAASKFVNLAKRFASKIEIVNPAKTVDGKSIMSIMLLAASQGTEIGLRIEGEDEARCDAGDHRPHRRPVRRRRIALGSARYGHALDEQRTGHDVAATIGVVAEPDERTVHVGELAGDGDLVDRMHDLAV